MPKLAQSTINRVIASGEAVFHGIIPARVNGSSRPRYTYSEAAANAAKKEIVKKSTKDFIGEFMVEDNAKANAEILARSMTEVGVNSLAVKMEELDEAIKTKSEWFVTDEAEQLVLTRFREVRTAYNNDEKVLFSLFSNAQYPFDQDGIDRMVIALNKPDMPLLNKHIAAFVFIVATIEESP
jgi:hypothetical protein